MYNTLIGNIEVEFCARILLSKDETNILGLRKTCYLLLGNEASCNNLGIIQGREAQLIKIVKGTNYKAFKKSVIFIWQSDFELFTNNS